MSLLKRLRYAWRVLRGQAAMLPELPTDGPFRLILGGEWTCTGYSISFDGRDAGPRVELNLIPTEAPQATHLFLERA